MSVGVIRVVAGWTPDITVGIACDTFGCTLGAIAKVSNGGAPRFTTETNPERPEGDAGVGVLVTVVWMVLALLKYTVQSFSTRRSRSRLVVDDVDDLSQSPKSQLSALQ